MKTVYRNGRGARDNIVRMVMPPLLYLCISIFVSGAVYAAVPAASADMLLASAVSAAAAAPVFFYLMKKDKRDRKNRSLFMFYDGTGAGSRYLWLLAPISVSFCALSNLLVDISGISRVFTGYSDISSSLFTGNVWEELLATALIIPIVEEMVFRGLIYERLREWLEYKPAIVVSSLCFGIYHGNMVQLVYAFLAGCLIAWVFEKYRSIFAPVLTHIMLNAVSVFITELQILGRICASYAALAAALCISGAILVVCLYVLVKKTGKDMG